MEGFRSELDLLHKQMQGVELRLYGKRTPLMELAEDQPIAAATIDGKVAVTRKQLRAVQSRIAELEHGAVA